MMRIKGVLSKQRMVGSSPIAHSIQLANRAGHKCPVNRSHAVTSPLIFITVSIPALLIIASILTLSFAMACGNAAQPTPVPSFAPKPSDLTEDGAIGIMIEYLRGRLECFGRWYEEAGFEVNYKGGGMWDVSTTIPRIASFEPVAGVEVKGVPESEASWRLYERTMTVFRMDAPPECSVSPSYLRKNTH